MAADFNMTPEEGEECGLVDIMGGLVVVPKGAEFTCSSGQGRMIDFWMMSEDARRYFINERILYGTPWKPHFAIGIDVVKQPTAVVGRMAKKSAPILSEANKKCTVDKLTRAKDEDWDNSEEYAEEAKAKLK